VATGDEYGWALALALTGQRMGDVARLTWRENESLDLMELPQENRTGTCAGSITPPAVDQRSEHASGVRVSGTGPSRAATSGKFLGPWRNP
jgi:hypothetical protein